MKIEELLSVRVKFKHDGAGRNYEAIMVGYFGYFVFSYNFIDLAQLWNVEDSFVVNEQRADIFRDMNFSKLIIIIII